MGRWYAGDAVPAPHAVGGGKPHFVCIDTTQIEGEDGAGATFSGVGEWGFPTRCGVRWHDTRHRGARLS